MEHPVKPALAQAVPVIPDGPDWWYEPKFDGHRTILRRTEETTILYARSGRVVTSHWIDLAVAGMQLPPGTTLDGEAVIWKDGKISFAAAQSRAASSITRARALAAQHPASYLAWDVLEHPDRGQVTGLPYTERRQLLVGLLHDIPPPIQAVPATDDRDVAIAWYDGLQEQGIEGIVAKKGTAPTRSAGATGSRSGTPTPKTHSSSATSDPDAGHTGSHSPPATKVHPSGYPHGSTPYSPGASQRRSARPRYSGSGRPKGRRTPESNPTSSSRCSPAQAGTGRSPSPACGSGYLRRWPPIGVLIAETLLPVSPRRASTSSR